MRQEEWKRLREIFRGNNSYDEFKEFMNKVSEWSSNAEHPQETIDRSTVAIMATLLLREWIFEHLSSCEDSGILDLSIVFLSASVSVLVEAGESDKEILRQLSFDKQWISSIRSSIESEKETRQKYNPSS